MLKTFNKHKSLILAVLVLVGLPTLFYIKLSNKLKSLVHYSKRSYRFLSATDIQKAEFFKDAPEDYFLCSRLQMIPFGEETGVVKRVKKIELKEIATPYNASLIEDENGYLLFFRYDIKQKKKYGGLIFPLKSYIGVAALDKEFNQVKEVVTIDTKSDYSEDPRIIRMGKDLFLSYNDLAENSVYSRTMRLSCLEPNDFSVKYSVDLDQHIQPIEKNWVPFTVAEGNSEHIFFGYSLNPHKILKMNDPKINELQHLVFSNEVCLQDLPWHKNWGILRGGTPPKLVDGRYLAFFHSCFKEDDKKWYVMGAYTFDPVPPFRINAMSKYPIIFKGIYDTPPQNTSHNQLRCIFPAGFALGKEDGKDVIHVSCGENDCAVKIVTLDKELLLKSLSPIPKACSLGD